MTSYITVNIDSLPLPPTPPSSSCSDSDGGLSPQRSAPSSPIRHMPLKASHHCSSTTSSKPYSQPFFTNPVSISNYRSLDEGKGGGIPVNSQFNSHFF